MPAVSQYSQITVKEINGMIFDELENAAMMNWVGPLSLFTTSNSAQEKYGWLGQVPIMRKWDGPRELKQLTEFNFTIVNEPYEATLAVNKKDQMRDKTGQLKIRIADLARREQSHWANLLSTLINNAKTENSFDGVSFFNASHESGDSGTLSNLLTSTDVTDLNVATATAPTASEMANAINGVIGQFYTFKDDQGEPINEGATKFIVMTGAAPIWRAAQTAATKRIVEGTIDNPIVDSGLTIEVVFNSRLSTDFTDEFIVFRSDDSIGPFIRQQEGPIEVESLVDGSDHAFKNHEWLFGINTSRAAGFGLWQNAIHATLS